MSTFLASDRVASLDGNLRITIAAKVVGGGAIDTHSTLISTAHGRSLGWNLVCFTRHIWIWWRMCGGLRISDDLLLEFNFEVL